MNKQFQVVAWLVLGFVILWPGCGLAGLVDEGGQTDSEANQGVTDRPLRQTVNLKQIQGAFDDSDPRANVKTFGYSSNVTFKVRLREYMQTTVILPQGEEIGGHVLGDSANFYFMQINPAGTKNRFIIWGRDPGADTNLTIFGASGNIYSFYLRIDSVKSNFLPDLVVFVEDSNLHPVEVKKTEEKKIEGEDEFCEDCLREDIPKRQYARDYLRELPYVDPNQVNENYVTSKGDKTLSPLAIFDDGYFTYFQYGETSLDKVKVPIIYQVIDGYDTLANTRVKKGYIIVETTNDKWTIRRGEKYLCVRNKKYWKNKVTKLESEIEEKDSKK